MIETVIALVGAVLLGIGLFSLFLLFNSKKSGGAFAKTLFVTLIFIIAGGWMIFGFINLAILLRKFIGIFLIFLGVFFVVRFPGGYAQYEGFTKIVVLLGFILMVFGIYLTLF